jgi:hypothetical protein
LDRTGDGQDGRDQPVLGAPDLGRAGLRPHRVRAFKLSNDPKFAAKLKEVVGLGACPRAG